MKLTIDIKTKWLIRFLAVLLLCGFIIPAFTMSCGKQDVTVSGVKLLIGISLDSERIVGANLGMLLLLAIPIAIFIIWSVYRGKDIKDAALLTIILSAIGWSGWIIVLIAIAVYTAKYSCDFKISAGFLLNILGYGSMLALSVAELIQKMRKSKVKSVKMLRKQEARSTGEREIKNCPVCQKPLKLSFSFCTHCGTKI